MYKNIYIFALLSVLGANRAVKTYIEGYYWRDYEGIAPEDALPGGQDANGRPIFVGQLLFEDKLLPGKIYETDSKIFVEWSGREVSSTKNVKILCAQAPEDFEWISTKNNEIESLTNKFLIKGGYELGHSIYVGRVYTFGETSVGKIVCQERQNNCLGLYVPKNGKGIEYKSFEVLTYNPDGANINCSPIKNETLN